MKNIIIKIGIIACILFCGGCNLLDTEPKNFVSPDTYYDTKEQVESALLGVYSTLASTALYANNMLGRMGLSADIGYESYSVDQGTVGYYDVFPTDTKVTTYWRDLYDGIGRANLLLVNINKAPMSDKDRDNIRGQALFLRAYYHFMLVLRFGNIPLILEPLKSVNQKDLQIPQEDPRVVYLKIIQDMNDAVELLLPANEVESAGRVSQSAVYGILARICLNFAGEPLKEPGMYAEAKKYAEKVIELNFHELNPSFEDVFIKYMQDMYDIKESIWEVELYGNNIGTYTTTAGMVGRNNGIGLAATSIHAPELGSSIGSTRTTEYYFFLFEREDLRRDWTIAPYIFVSASGEKTWQTDGNAKWIRFCGKFRREYELIKPKSNSYSSTNWPLLRYSDILLMYAEGVAADNQSTETDLIQAYEYLNRVRRRGYGKDIFTPDPAVDIAKDSKSSLWEVIKEERARELGFELLRKDDVVRWGEFYQRMKYIQASIPSAYTSSYYVAARETYANVSEKDILWPIPSYDMGVNRKLVQNKGW